jgi:hypothetical protein
MEEEHICNSDNECDSDYSDDENKNDPPCVTEQVKDAGNIHVSTEGIAMDELPNQGLDANSLFLKYGLKQCGFCNKFFKQDMIIPNKSGGQDDTQCWHCLFWMNYSVQTRKQVDGSHGMTIADYIMKCKDIHEIKTCTRNSDSGGCFLCEYNLGLPLTDIKDVYKLNRSSEIPDYPIDDQDDGIDMDDSYKLGKMVVEI